jgi:hypothetical protein
MRVISAPPASARAIAIEVDTQVPGIERDEAALRTGLRNEFATLGYQVDSGDLVLKATITKLHRGDTSANVTFGLGIGSDTIDVSVAHGDSRGDSQSFRHQTEASRCLGIYWIGGAEGQN